MAENLYWSLIVFSLTCGVDLSKRRWPLQVDLGFELGFASLRFVDDPGG